VVGFEVKDLKIVALALVLAVPALAGTKPPVKHKATVTKQGEYRQQHYQTAPNKTQTDNYSAKGNTNPYTGKPGTKKVKK
jgi:hypothetical protein